MFREEQDSFTWQHYIQLQAQQDNSENAPMFQQVQQMHIENERVEKTHVSKQELTSDWDFSSFC